MKNELRTQIPKAYGNYLVVKYGDQHYVTPRDKWPLSQTTITKIWSEILNNGRISESRVETLMIMWTCENQMPKYLAEPTSDFRYVYRFLVLMFE